MTTVREIIAQWLREHGYDGLYHPGDCGCLISDLCPCGEDSMQCSPGYKQTDPEYDWAIGPKQESEEGDGR